MYKCLPFWMDSLYTKENNYPAESTEIQPVNTISTISNVVSDKFNQDLIDIYNAAKPSNKSHVNTFQTEMTYATASDSSKNDIAAIVIVLVNLVFVTIFVTINFMTTLVH